MPSLICVICLEPLQTKTSVSTTCGHIFCSKCAIRQLTAHPTCPVCRRGQTAEQLIRLFPVYDEKSPDALSDATSSSDTPHQTLQMPHPQPFQNPPPSLFSPPSQSIASRRFWLDVTSTRFPWVEAGSVPACHRDGSPVFLGLAAFKNGLHPCKICVNPQGRPVPYVSYGGKEYMHKGTTLLLPFDPAAMEWVVTGHMRIPAGRRPVEGGYERIGVQALFHARAVVDGVTVPGKAGDHIWGANVPYNGKEHMIVSEYEVLCWRE